MLKRAFLIVSVVAVCASCQRFAEGRKMFHDLLTLRDQIATQFHEKVVDVNIANGRDITIKFMNSPLQGAPRDVKQKRADEVAAFVAANYKHPVASVTTAFVSKRGALEMEETLTGSLAK